jgi:hypothetical protein
MVLTAPRFKYLYNFTLLIIIQTSHRTTSRIYLVILFYSILQATRAQKKNLLTEKSLTSLCYCVIKILSSTYSKASTLYTSYRTILSVGMILST